MRRLVLLLALSGCARGPSTPPLRAGIKRVRIGAVAALLPLMLDAAQKYMQGSPATLVIVSGETESDALAGLRADSFELAALTQPVNDPRLAETRVAGVVEAVMVHPKNQLVKGITRAQLRDMIVGRIESWLSVGGENQRMIFIHRPRDSGEWTFLRGFLGELPTTVGDEEATAIATQSALLARPGAVSMLPLAYAHPQLRTLAVDGVIATVSNARARSYRLVVPGEVATRAQPDDETRAFVAFLLSPLLQPRYQELGYLRPEEMH